MANQTASQTKPATEAKTADTEELGRQIETIRRDIAVLTDLIAELGRSRRDAASQQGQQKVTELRSRAEAAGVDAMERVNELGERAQAQVREQPAAALLVATGIGFLAGLLMRRK